MNDETVQTSSSKSITDIECAVLLTVNSTAAKVGKKNKLRGCSPTTPCVQVLLHVYYIQVNMQTSAKC